MTETCSQIATLGEQDVYRKIGSAGKALFPAEIDIIHKNDAAIGEIIVKGPMVMQAYDGNEADEESFVNGWFKTGDLGYIDSDGFLFVVDRRTDLIISGGENIYPTEIEDVLLKMANIHEAAVVGKRDEKWGEVPVAWVVRSNEQVTAKKIQHYANQQLAGYKVPKEIHFIAELPRNASNKIMRHQLKERSAKN
jgi:O-succinylbenzoic acid--CoA ligase